MSQEDINRIKIKLEENLTDFGLLMHEEVKLRHDLNELKEKMEANAKEFNELQRQLRLMGEEF